MFYYTQEENLNNGEDTCFSFFLLFKSQRGWPDPLGLRGHTPEGVRSRSICPLDPAPTQINMKNCIISTLVHLANLLFTYKQGKNMG